MIQSLDVRMFDGDTVDCLDVTLQFSKYGIIVIDADGNEVFGIQYNGEDSRVECLRFNKKGEVDGSLFSEVGYE